MSERTVSRPAAISALVIVAVISGALMLAARTHFAHNEPPEPRDALLRAVGRLATAERFTATTEYTPHNAHGSSFPEVLESDGASARVRWDWSAESCSWWLFEEHWLGRFGRPIESWTAPEAEPQGFRWISAPVVVEFNYLDLSIDSRITVHATAWLDRDGNLVRVERDISDEIGFQGVAFTTIDYGAEPTCL